jgi:hypothetical protein
MPHAEARWAAEDNSDDGSLAEFVGELAGERRCVACAPASGRGRPIGGSDLVSENCVPCAFGDRGRREKPEKDDDDDTLFDRTA